MPLGPSSFGRLLNSTVTPHQNQIPGRYKGCSRRERGGRDEVVRFQRCRYRYCDLRGGVGSNSLDRIHYQGRINSALQLSRDFSSTLPISQHDSGDYRSVFGNEDIEGTAQCTVIHNLEPDTFFAE